MQLWIHENISENPPKCAKRSAPTSEIISQTCPASVSDSSDNSDGNFRFTVVPLEGFAFQIQVTTPVGDLRCVAAAGCASGDIVTTRKCFDDEGLVIPSTTWYEGNVGTINSYNCAFNEGAGLLFIGPNKGSAWSLSRGDEGVGDGGHAMFVFDDEIPVPIPQYAC